MKRTNLTTFYLIAALVLVFLYPHKDEASAQLTAKANHDDIKIDFFYDGSEVSVRGESDPGVDLVVKITSPETHQALKKKGRVAGVLWMNVGDLKCEKTPNLYFVQSTRKIEDILPPAEMDKYVIGYPALERHVELTPVKSEAEKAEWFGQFVKFKENSNLYFTASGGFKLSEKDNKQQYYMKFKWPYQAPPGDYLVTVYAVKDMKVVEQATSKVLVEQVGAVKSLSEMAKNHGAFYGILAIISALGAGFGVGLVFRKGGGAH
jgi:uncharacterized protein (TIGR02186 family)